MGKRDDMSKDRLFWVCTELLEATTQTGPFSSRLEAKKHKRKCIHGLCGGPDSYVLKATKPPFYASVFPPNHGTKLNG